MEEVVNVRTFKTFETYTFVAEMFKDSRFSR